MLKRSCLYLVNFKGLIQNIHRFVFPFICVLFIALASKLLLYLKVVQVIVYNFTFYYLLLEAGISWQLGGILEK